MMTTTIRLSTTLSSLHPSPSPPRLHACSFLAVGSTYHYRQFDLCNRSIIPDRRNALLERRNTPSGECVGPRKVDGKATWWTLRRGELKGKATGVGRCSSPRERARWTPHAHQVKAADRLEGWIEQPIIQLVCRPRHASPRHRHTISSIIPQTASSPHRRRRRSGCGCGGGGVVRRSWES